MNGNTYMDHICIIFDKILTDDQKKDIMKDNYVRKNIIIRDLYSDDINKLYVDNKEIYKRVYNDIKEIDSKKSENIIFNVSKGVFPSTKKVCRPVLRKYEELFIFLSKRNHFQVITWFPNNLHSHWQTFFIKSHRY